LYPECSWRQGTIAEQAGAPEHFGYNQLNEAVSPWSMGIVLGLEESEGGFVEEGHLDRVERDWAE
jgi:hypothetical protein